MNVRSTVLLISFGQKISVFEGLVIHLVCSASDTSEWLLFRCTRLCTPDDKQLGSVLAHSTRSKFKSHHVAQHQREREVHYVHWASKAYEDESVFVPEAHLGWQ